MSMAMLNQIRALEAEVAGLKSVVTELGAAQSDETRLDQLESAIEKIYGRLSLFGAGLDKLEQVPQAITERLDQFATRIYALERHMHEDGDLDSKHPLKIPPRPDDLLREAGLPPETDTEDKP